MNEYLYLLIFLVFILFVVSLIFSKNIFSPVSIITISYLVSLLLVIPNIENWNVNLHFLTFNIVFLGLLLFLAGYAFYTRFISRGKKKPTDYELIKIPNYAIVLFLLFQVITLIVFYYSVSNIVGGLTIGNFSSAMEKYRALSAYSDELVSIPSYAIQMSKICNIIFYFSIYIFFNNLFYIKKKKNNASVPYKFFTITTFIIQAFLSILTAGRYNLICLILGGIIMYTIIKVKDKTHIGSNFKVKDYFKIICVFLIIVVLFSGMRTIVGRTNSSGLFTYISSYFGGSVPLLDKYFCSYSSSSTYPFGYNTFYSIYRLLSMFGLSSSYRLSNFDFMYSGSLFGNVYTGFYVMYKDFGLIGVVILQFISGLLWAYLFNKVYLKCNNCKKYLVYCIIYCIHISSLFLHPFGENFFSKVFSQSFILELIYISIVYFLIFKIKDQEKR